MTVLPWILALTAPAFYAWRTWGLLGLNLKVGMNDDVVAKEMFVKLLNNARREMWICDDGDNFSGSIYNMPEIVKAIEDRLQSNQQLRLFCLFSSEDQTRFTQDLEGNPRVHVKRAQPRRDVHFKIIDDGTKGYVSAHPRGSFERRYRSYDCTRAPKHIRQAALGRHLDGMKGMFSKERTVA